MERPSRSRSRSPATTPRAAAIYAQSRSRSRSRSPRPRQSRNQSPSSQPRSNVVAPVQQMSLQNQQQVLAVVNMVVDPLLRRIDALESEVRRLVWEVRRLSGNQGSASDPRGDIRNAFGMVDQYFLDQARFEMQMKAIREGRG